jgi:hypothetical protein
LPTEEELRAAFASALHSIPFDRDKWLGVFGTLARRGRQVHVSHRRLQVLVAGELLNGLARRAAHRQVEQPAAAVEVAAAGHSVRRDDDSRTIVAERLGAPSTALAPLCVPSRPGDANDYG